MNPSQSTPGGGRSGEPFPFCRLSLLLSVMLPYLPPNLRRPLLLFAKLYECMECLNSGRSLDSDYAETAPKSQEEQWSDIFSRLSPLLSEQERSRIEQMQNMLQMMKLYQNLQEMAPFMNQNSDALFSMLSPDQQEMFQAMSSVMQDTAVPEDS
ncbi:MAG: hypothetical protein K2N94_16100 [Lachnospiraceae bacterium]|nr:hypothetical protein [Lachnospiraceae bacterium]